MNKIPPLIGLYEETLERLVGPPRIRAALKTLDEGAAASMELQVALCEIPAPTFKEQERAAEMVRRMKAVGLTDVSIDSIGNVIGRRPGRGNGPVLAIGAHMDTVFPEGTDVTVRREGNRYYGPGIGDDCAGLRALLETARAFNEAGIETEGDIWFVGTVGEEGNGDIRGSKHLFNGENHIDGFLAIDNTDVGRILHSAVGSRRYRFTIKGPGGHSFAAFGRCPSAIHAACLAGARIAHIKVPDEPKTTFTIGTIRGGTSVNTIAASCECDVDVRSLSEEALAGVEKQVLDAFRAAVEEENAIWGVESEDARVHLEITKIGDRPAGVRPHECPVIQSSRAAQKWLGIELTNYSWSSTDANMPMSLGIPSTCLSAGGVQARTHTIHESFDCIDIELGPKLVFLAAALLVGAEGGVPLLPVRA